jgi:hypothetical protein
LVCVLACGHAVTPAPSPASIILAGPTVAAESLRVAATDSFGVARARHLAPRAQVHVVSDREALDLVDSGADIIVTDRAPVIRYAASRTDFATIPLPWDRQYALVSAFPTSVPDVLDAVHADARVAQQHCPVDSARAPAQRVAYSADDSIARSLAERLVGLGVARRATPFGRDTVPPFILARPIDGGTCEIGAGALILHVTPLVETRSHLVVRRGAVGVVADTAGSVRLETTP